MLGIKLPKEVKEATFEELHLEFLVCINISCVKITSQVELYIGGVGEEFPSNDEFGNTFAP